MGTISFENVTSPGDATDWACCGTGAKKPATPATPSQMTLTFIVHLQTPDRTSGVRASQWAGLQLRGVGTADLPVRSRPPGRLGRPGGRLRTRRSAVQKQH